ncbi:GNAT family N-acetyltransferase [Guggenheimella bovis]
MKRMLIHGDRVYLSPVDKLYIERITDWVNDLEVTVGLGVSSEIMTVEKEEQFLDSALKGNDKHFMINLIENEEPIGIGSVHEIQSMHRSGKVGLFIGEKEYRNKGLGTEALSLLLAFGFQVLSLHSITLCVFSFNERAIRSYEKVGFKKCGERREVVYHNGRFYHEILMDILEDEYRKSPFYQPIESLKDYAL